MTAAIRSLKFAAAPQTIPAAAPPLLNRQLTFLAAALFIVSLGYGALMPVLPAWLAQFPGSNAVDIARHVGFLSGAYVGLVFVPTYNFFAQRFDR